MTDIDHKKALLSLEIEILEDCVEHFKQMTFQATLKNQDLRALFLRDMNLAIRLLREKI